MSPRFVTTDEFNRIYVADPEADQVIRIDDMTARGRRYFSSGATPVARML